MNQDKPKRPRGTGSIFQMKGSAVYWIKYYRNGKAVRESSGSDKPKAAERLLQKRIGEVAANIWVSPLDKRLTVDDLYSALLDDYRANNLASLEGTLQRWTAKIDGKEVPGRLNKFFTGIRAIAVTTDILNRYVTQCRESGLSNATINRDLAALRRAFNLALRAGKIQAIPFFPHLKESAPRSGFLEPADYDKLKARAPELWLRSLLACFYTWGNRKSELLNLKVSQVDLMNRLVRLNAGETKSGDGRVLPMTQEVYTLLAACISGKGQDDYVFTDERGNRRRKAGARILDFRGRWERLLKDADLSGRIVHDFRRSAVRNLERSGVPRSVAMQISGHKTESVYRRYDIVSERDVLAAAGKIEAAREVWAEFGQDLTASETQKQQQNTGKDVN